LKADKCSTCAIPHYSRKMAFKKRRRFFFTVDEIGNVGWRVQQIIDAMDGFIIRHPCVLSCSYRVRCFIL
jgi:hypothetical protein